MRFGTTLLLACCLVAGSLAFAQQSSPPRRTITSRSDSGVTPLSDQKTSSDVSPSSAGLERYREMWQKMTPAQQKIMVSAGGYTPEQYQRMLKQRGAGPSGAADSSNTADSGVLDSLSKSLQDLNAIRDGNLSLLQKDGCAPELASRIADLRGKLQTYEFELTGAETPIPEPAGAHRTEKAGMADPLALAADWFKRPGEPKPAAAPADAAGRTREVSLLDAALAGTESAATPERRIDPKSPDAERQRKVIEADMARVKAELQQLSSACAGANK